MYPYIYMHIFNNPTFTDTPLLDNRSPVIEESTLLIWQQQLAEVKLDDR